MRLPLAIFNKASSPSAGGGGVVVPDPDPTPVVTAGLLRLTATTGSTADVGSVITARLQDGVTGTFQFVRQGNDIDGAVGSGNSANYTVLSADADQLIDVKATDLIFTAGLTASPDTTTLFSFSGSSATGSVLTAQFAIGYQGQIDIKRSNGTVAATVGAGGSLTYTVLAGDQALLPFSAVASSITLTAAIPLTAGATVVNPFLTVRSKIFGSDYAKDDSVDAVLGKGVSGLFDFTSNGVKVTSATGKNNADSYLLLSSDAGHTMGVVVSHLTFETGGIFGTPVIQSGTTAPFLYSITGKDSKRIEIALGYMPLNNLDTTSVPLASDFTIGGNIRTPKTVASVALDNSSSERKYVRLTLSSPQQTGDDTTVSYAGTAIKYVGGTASAPAFTGLHVATDLLPLPTMMYPKGGAAQYDHTQAAGTIAMSTTPGAANAFEAGLVYNQNEQRDWYSPDDVTVQMTILPDWGTDTTITRLVSFSNALGAYGYFRREQESIYRTGNTVALYEKPVPDVNTSQSVQVGASYTFTSPGPLCAARLIRTRDDFLTRMQVSLDGGDTWTTVATGALVNKGGFACTAWSSSTTVPVTGVGITGLPP